MSDLTPRILRFATRRPTRAFTLVELLVVIAILTALIALLVPGLRRAREQGRSAKCASQLRSLVAVMASYANEDRRNQAVPAHPIADRNALHDEGFFDFGGATGASNVWGGARFGPTSERTAPTRPLNRFLYPGGVTESVDLEIYRCPGDQGLGRVDVGNPLFWDPAMRSQSMFESVGTSYCANAYRARADEATDGFDGMLSVGTFLRSMSAIGSAGETVLLSEVPMWYSAAEQGVGVSPAWIARPSWHGETGEHNVAFADGHAAKTRATRLKPDSHSVERWASLYLRGPGFRFDCLPSPPIVDLPNEIAEP